MNGVFYGLLSALSWGCSDFTGGVVTRKHTPSQVTLLVSLAGAATVALLAFWRGEPWLTQSEALWAAVAGVCGGLGLAFLYAGLASGRASLVAPIAAVVGAALPVVLSLATEGWPAAGQGLGLLLGLAGIWLVSSAPDPGPAVGVASQAGRARAAGLALVAGVFFGLFFILIARSSAHSVFMPLTVSKLTSAASALFLLLVQRQPLPSFRRMPLTLLGGMLDSGGNLFYVLAQQNTRMDIAVTVSSMYPVGTVILSALIFRERATPRQAAGLATCLGALALIVSA